MSESKPNAVERLQMRAAWTAYYEIDADIVNRLILENAALQQAIRDQDANECSIRELKQENDSLVGICNSKEVQLKEIGYQLEKGIKAVEQFLANESLPYTEGFWKLAKPLEEFAASAKEELRLWEDKQ